MNILWDNIPIFMLVTTFGGKVEDSWQNLPTGHVVAFFNNCTQLNHNSQDDWTSTSSTKNFVPESVKPTTQAHPSSTRLLPHEWQGWVHHQNRFSSLRVNQCGNQSRSTQPTQHDMVNFPYGEAKSKASVPLEIHGYFMYIIQLMLPVNPDAPTFDLV